MDENENNTPADETPEVPTGIEIHAQSVLDTLDETQLVDLHGVVSTEIESAKDTGLAGRQRRGELREYRNAIARTLNALRTPESTEEVELLPAAIVEAPQAPAAADASEAEAVVELDLPAVEAPELAMTAAVDAEDIGEPPAPGGAAPRVAAVAREVEHAPRTASVSNEVLSAGEQMDDDAFGDAVRMIWDSGEAGRARIAAFDLVGHHGDALPRLGDSVRQNDSILGDPNSVSMHQAAQAMTAAICDTPDIRRDIAQCGDDSQPIRAMFGQFASSNMTIEYHEALRITGTSGIGDGTGIWSPAERAAYEAAVAAGDANAILAAQKTCLRVTCTDPVQATALPVYACVESCIETQYSHPEVIAATETAVKRQFARRSDTVLLDAILAESFVFNVDPATFGTGTSATTKILEAIHVLTPAVVIEERQVEPSWTAVIPYGMPGLFTQDGMLRADCCEQLSLASGMNIDNVVVTKDRPTGFANPFTPLVGVNPGEGYFDDWDVALRGPANAADLTGFPEDGWWMALVDTASWFYFSPFNINLGVFRGDAQVKSNCTRNMFMETAHGLARNGCQPSIWLNFGPGLCANGERSALAEPNCA